MYIVSASSIHGLPIHVQYIKALPQCRSKHLLFGEMNSPDREEQSPPDGAQVFQLNRVYYSEKIGVEVFHSHSEGEKRLQPQSSLPGRWYGTWLIKRQIRAQRRIRSADAGSPRQTELSLARFVIRKPITYKGLLCLTFVYKVVDQYMVHVRCAISYRI